MATLQLPQQLPSPTQDSETLRKAFQGWKTDEKALIQVLGHRNATQRKIIGDTYYELYHQSLIDSLNSKVSGDFWKALILWTCEPVERDARMLNKALNSKKIGMNEVRVIVEISYTSPPFHMMAVVKCYSSLFNSSVRRDISRNVPSSIEMILAYSVLPFRYPGPEVDLDKANEDATKLKEAIESKEFECNFAWTIGTRSFFQLKAIFESYHRKYGKHISEDIKDCGDDMLEDMLKTAIRCVVSPEKHFAEVIGAATDQDSLLRVILRRAEIDLVKVSEAYLEMNGTSLENAVKRNTSGNYQALLMTLLGHDQCVGFTMKLTAILHETRKRIWRVSRVLVDLYKGLFGGGNKRPVVNKMEDPFCERCYLLHIEGFSDGLVRDYDGYLRSEF